MAMTRSASRKWANWPALQEILRVWLATFESVDKAVSTLVKLPNFIPGLGTLYVDPSTLPAGPFLGYDHDGHLVDTVYMIPLAQMKAGMNIKDLKAPAGTVDHVEVMYNAGHPGVAEPHIHVILWNVPVAQETAVAK